MISKFVSIVSILRCPNLSSQSYILLFPRFYFSTITPDWEPIMSRAKPYGLTWTSKPRFTVHQIPIYVLFSIPQLVQWIRVSLYLKCCEFTFSKPLPKWYSLLVLEICCVMNRKNSLANVHLVAMLCNSITNSLPYWVNK